MNTTQAKYIIQTLTVKEILFEHGLTDDEVLQIEKKFNLKFPPDLKLFLQIALPVSDGFVNWRLGLSSDEAADKIFARIDWPLEGMLFDIENGFWFEAWDNKPDDYVQKATIAKKHYEAYPKLIPICSHRYIPSRPNQVGNPIFSVYQMDIIYYGYDLAMYLAHEFNFVLPKDFRILEKPNLSIEFWSEVVE